MTDNERKALLINQLTKTFEPYGFKWVKTNNSLSLTKGKDIFSYKIYVTHHFVNIEIYLKINFNIIESIKRKALGVKETYFTASNNLCWLTKDTDHCSFWVTDKAEVLKVVDYLHQKHLDFGQYYFEKYSDIYKLDKILNQDKDEEAINALVPYLSHRLILAIIVSKLTNNLEFKYHIDKYYKEIVAFEEDGYFVEDYNKVVKYLLNN